MGTLDTGVRGLLSSLSLSLPLSLSPSPSLLNAQVCNLSLSISHMFSLTRFLPPCSSSADAWPCEIRGGPSDAGTQGSARPGFSFHLWSGLLNGKGPQGSQVHPWSAHSSLSSSLPLSKKRCRTLAQSQGPSHTARQPLVDGIHQLWSHQY